MITLNSDQGLIRVDSWDEIESRPGFTPNLNPKEHQLHEIIGRYQFKEEIPCGLSNCRTPHGRGYIVVTENGRSTNIGKDCGKRYFGVDFETLSRRFDREMDEAEYREALHAFRNRLSTVTSELTELRKEWHGLDWVYRTGQALLSRTKVPQDVVTKIQGMVRNGTGTLTVEREAEEGEIEALEAMEGRTLPRPYMISESIGTLRGIQALYPENDLREVVVMNLEPKLGEFEELDIDSMEHKDLKWWSKWVGSVDSQMEKVRESLRLGRELLTSENLAPLLKTISNKADKREFTMFVRQLDK